MTALLEVRGLVKGFSSSPPTLRRSAARIVAVDGVDLDVAAGETLAVVGESGSGKTTLARAILRLVEPDAGAVRFRGEDLLALSPAALRRRRRHFQMVFQDPWSSLDPRMKVGDALFEPLRVHRLASASERTARVSALLEEVGLPPAAAALYPHEFSGGQRQRIGIARALATRPGLLIADEPVSALDVSVRAQIVNLLAGLQQRHQLAMLFIAHDLPLVEQVADRIAVFYLGRVVELGPGAAVLGAPQHPYTSALLSAVPDVDPERRRRRIALAGGPPSPTAVPSGCRFHPRCPIARPRCRHEDPPRVEPSPGRSVACFFPGELGAGPVAGGRNFSAPGPY